MSSKINIRFISIICITVLAMFSIFIFPFILAASPGNLRVAVIEAEDSLPEDTSIQVFYNGLDSTPEAGLEPEPFPTPVPEPSTGINADSIDRAARLALSHILFRDWGIEYLGIITEADFYKWIRDPLYHVVIEDER